MDGGPEPITDPAELAAIRWRAAVVVAKSLIATTIVAMGLLLVG